MLPLLAPLPEPRTLRFLSFGSTYCSSHTLSNGDFCFHGPGIPYCHSWGLILVWQTGLGCVGQGFFGLNFPVRSSAACSTPSTCCCISVSLLACLAAACRLTGRAHNNLISPNGCVNNESLQLYQPRAKSRPAPTPNQSTNQRNRTPLVELQAIPRANALSSRPKGRCRL